MKQRALREYDWQNVTLLTEQMYRKVTGIELT